MVYYNNLANNIEMVTLIFFKLINENQYNYNEVVLIIIKILNEIRAEKANIYENCSRIVNVYLLSSSRQYQLNARWQLEYIRI